MPKANPGTERYTALAAHHPRWHDTSVGFADVTEALRWMVSKADEGYGYRSLFDEQEREVLIQAGS